MLAIFDFYSHNNRPKEHYTMISQTFALLDLLIKETTIFMIKK